MITGSVGLPGSADLAVGLDVVSEHPGGVDPHARSRSSVTASEVVIASLFSDSGVRPGAVAAVAHMGQESQRASPQLRRCGVTGLVSTRGCGDSGVEALRIALGGSKITGQHDKGFVA